MNSDFHECVGVVHCVEECDCPFFFCLSPIQIGTRAHYAIGSPCDIGNIYVSERLTNLLHLNVSPDRSLAFHTERTIEIPSVMYHGTSSSDWLVGSLLLTGAFWPQNRVVIDIRSDATYIRTMARGSHNGTRGHIKVRRNQGGRERRAAAHLQPSLHHYLPVIDALSRTYVAVPFQVIELALTYRNPSPRQKPLTFPPGIGSHLNRPVDSEHDALLLPLDSFLAVILSTAPMLHILRPGATLQ